MDVVSNTENAMKVLAGTLAPGNCTTLTKQQNSADLCSYQTVDDLKAFEFVQEVETSASSSQDSLDADFSDFDPDDGNFTLVVLRKENNLNRTVFLNETETEVAYNETTQEVNSALLTFSLFVEGNKTSVPVTFRLQHIEDTGTKILPIDDTAFYEVIRTPICAFWNEINETWSTLGCKTVFSTTNFSKCDCSHSTNFGILMYISYKETKILPEITVLEPLDWLSYIGVGVSILALVLQLTIYIYLWTMLQFDRIFIHTNLVVALLVALILFVGGVDRGNGNPVVCKIIALFLHFFYLSVFGWMLVEGVHLYMKVVKVYGSENIKMYRYILIGWVAPAVICAISFGANNGGYGSKTTCWLVGYSIFLFVVPVIVVVMFNMIVFTMVIRIIMKSARLHQEKNYDHIKSGVKGALVLMPIMGMPWLFGLLMFDGSGEVFEYLFIIFNTLQGLFIFLIYCVFNSEVRAAFVRKRDKRRQEMALNSRILPMQSKVTETEFLPDPTSIQIEDDGLDHEPETVPEEDIVVSSRTSTPSCSSSMELPGTPSSPPVPVAPSEPDEPVATPEPIESNEPVATPEPIESNEPVATPEPIESNEPVATPEPIEQECLKTPPVSPVEALVLAPCPALKPHKNIISKRPLPKNKVEPWKYW
ncbi:adhesion G protein-coupled receptor L3-like isoform X2 [Asterias amurensis]|uniref:adhesion G protein-coupled receptor L3-like isoform X2 n=1 Tax=Asterias amurensis TaxID=7602 RepID=UPI003AB5355A